MNQEDNKRALVLSKYTNQTKEETLNIIACAKFSNWYWHQDEIKIIGWYNIKSCLI